MSEVSEDDQAQQVLPQLDDNLFCTINPEKCEDVPQIDEDIDKEDDEIGEGWILWK